MSTAIFPTFVTKVRQFVVQFRYFLISLVLLNISPLYDLAQEAHSHTLTPQHQESKPEQQSALIKIVRDATAQNYRWSSIILGIVESPSFLRRRTI